MTSSHGSTPETAYTQNSRAYPRRPTNFHLGELSETVPVNHQGVSADQRLSKAGSQLMELNSTPKMCLPYSQKTTMTETKQRLYNEGFPMKTLSDTKTLVSHSAAMCESQRVTLGDNQVALCHADQNPHEDHLIASLYEQPFNNDSEMPVDGAQTSYYSQMITGNGGQFPYGSQMPEPSCSQALHPSQTMSSFSDTTPFGDQQWNLNLGAGDMFYGDQMIAPDGHQTLYEDQMTDTYDQINDYGQMMSSSGQSIGSGQMMSSSGQSVGSGQITTLLGSEHTLSGYQAGGYEGGQSFCMERQMRAPVVDQPLYGYQMPTPSFDMTLHGSKWTNSSAEENLSWPLTTTVRCKEPFDWGHNETSVDQNVNPGQMRSLNIESLNPQLTPLSKETPYVGVSQHQSTSLLAQRQPLESSSASPSVQGQLPETLSDTRTQNPVSLMKSGSQKLYSCTFQDCGKSYTRAHHLRDHERKHTGEKPYVCNECPWKFSRSVDLQRHKRRHSGKMPFPCDKCSKTFSRMCYLRKHQRLHTQASPRTGI